MSLYEETAEERRRRLQRECSARNRARNRGEDVPHKVPDRSRSKSDSHKRRIGDSQTKAWKSRERMPLGSRRKDHHGYWLVKVREGGKWDKEHILIAEQSVDRKLQAGEHVHHINCIRDDNRPENLVILSAGAHSSAHHSLNDLVSGLMDDGLITFNRDTGRYERV